MGFFKHIFLSWNVIFLLKLVCKNSFPSKWARVKVFHWHWAVSEQFPSAHCRVSLSQGSGDSHPARRFPLAARGVQRAVSEQIQGAPGRVTLSQCRFSR